MASRLGVAVVRLAAASKQAAKGAGRAGMATTPAARAPVKQYSPVPKYLQEKMKTFQVPDGLPVYIKGGPVDKILYALTGAVCAVGLVECVHVWYVLSYPPEKK
ncbi:cytochrome c oxidase subunit 7A1, mitochondrial-like [Eriocheir sinensis]|uniref:cytochrome c oxidase subunit 7A1, mitochondrial-like n=1 Tax=Eriocheir sinensis TaxID=95602 RepID=UPI0021C85CEA|nr:cytochrome c oxidase subunit 7A1, mitochondrial-like [Eriocheir sinensis]